MKTVQDALDIIDATVDALEAEKVDLQRAARRVSAAEMVSRLNLPPFRQSAMDGYAVRAADLEGVSQAEPVRLRVVGEVAAGTSGGDDGSRDMKLEAGQAIRIFTGGRMPPQADAVVRQERVERRGDHIEVAREVPVGKDVRPAGEELSRGQRMVTPGRRLDARTITGLAMTGHDSVEVVRAPSVAVLVTGDEVVRPGGVRREGELFDANGPFLSNWLRERATGEVAMEYVPDERGPLSRALGNALESHDVVVTTGGVSVGDHDYVIDCAEELGVEREFWKLEQKPGKPLYFGRRAGTPLLGLPGNPGAVLTSAVVFLRRILDRLEGVAAPGPHFEAARSSRVIRQKPNRTVWLGGHLRVTDDGTRVFEPLLGHQSHRVGTLHRADALVRIEPGEGAIEEGDVVRCAALGPAGGEAA